MKGLANGLANGLAKGLSALGLCACLISCGPPATEGGFDSPNSAARMYAIEQAARDGDATAIGDLIELLDSDDPAVRFMAISTLERLTGQTMGYRHYDSAIDRRLAIEQWVAAYMDGRIQPMMSSPASETSRGAAANHAPPAPAAPDAPAAPADTKPSASASERKPNG